MTHLYVLSHVLCGFHSNSLLAERNSTPFEYFARPSRRGCSQSTHTRFSRHARNNRDSRLLILMTMFIFFSFLLDFILSNCICRCVSICQLASRLLLVIRATVPALGALRRCRQAAHRCERTVAAARRLAEDPTVQKIRAEVCMYRRPPLCGKHIHCLTSQDLTPRFSFSHHLGTSVGTLQKEVYLILLYFSKKN